MSLLLLLLALFSSPFVAQGICLWFELDVNKFQSTMFLTVLIFYGYFYWVVYLLYKWVKGKIK
jgi:hypothetical protein